MTKLHEKLKYPLGSTFGALPSSTDLHDHEHIVYDPEGRPLAVIDHKDPKVSKDRAMWIAQCLTLSLFEEQNPGCDVPIPVNEDQAALMALVGINWLKEHAPHKLASVVPEQQKSYQSHDDGGSRVGMGTDHAV